MPGSAGAAFHNASFPSLKRCTRRQQPSSCATPPTTFESLRAAAITATKAAIASDHKLIEIQFPAVPNMATAALNELLDANRNHARAIISAFTPNFSADDLHLVFPDSGEASLARKSFGDTPFCINAIPKSPPAYISAKDGLIVVVQPGFNVSEWINIQNLVGEMPVVTVNADLDKVRGGYYPRLFYPGLHRAKDNLLGRFEETYYLKMFSNGGTLLRIFPDHWRLFYTSMGGERELVWEGEERPAFREVERILSGQRTRDLQAR